MKMVRGRVAMSEDIDRRLALAERETNSDRSQVMLRALTLYFAALDHRKNGLKVGFAGFAGPGHDIDVEMTGFGDDAVLSQAA
jgi:predicted transcriptional regulator